MESPWRQGCQAVAYLFRHADGAGPLVRMPAIALSQRGGVRQNATAVVGRQQGWQTAGMIIMAMAQYQRIAVCQTHAQGCGIAVERGPAASIEQQGCGGRLDPDG